MTIPDDNSFVNGGKINMSVRTRIETIRLIEKMERHEAYSKKLGIAIRRDSMISNGTGKEKESEL